MDMAARPGSTVLEACTLPVSRSVVAPEGILSLLRTAYAMPGARECVPVRLSWNDTYRITVDKDTIYIMRVYGFKRHTLEAIHYELELLLHLAQHGVGVSTPLARTDGALVTLIQAPEGVRYAVLFTLAPGKVPVPFPLGDATQSGAIGRSMARLHTAGDSFQTSHARTPQDLNFLLDQPLARIEPLLAHRPEDWAYLLQLAATIRSCFTDTVIQQLDWGPIHGDPISANATMKDELVTWFDFDLCGPGWRILDLAAAFDSAMGQQKSDTDKAHIWSAFLAGYREIRPVPEQDLALIPIVLYLQYIYFMAVNLDKGPVYGFQNFGSDAFFDGYLQELRDISLEWPGIPT